MEAILSCSQFSSRYKTFWAWKCEQML